jgi:hypothetical protein
LREETLPLGGVIHAYEIIRRRGRRHPLNVRGRSS